MKVGRLKYLRMSAGAVDRVGERSLFEDLVDTGGDVGTVIEEGERHVSVSAYVLAAGSAMQLGVHQGFAPRGRFVVARGVSYYKGDTFGGPYRLRLTDSASSGERFVTIADIEDRFVVRCASVEMGRSEKI